MSGGSLHEVWEVLHMNLVKKVAIKKCQILEEHSFLSFWSQKLGLKYDYELGQALLGRKGRIQYVHTTGT